MNLTEFLDQYCELKSPLPDRYGDWLGYDIESVDKDKLSVVTALDIRDDHLSPSGAVHGGAISGFLDFSCGCAAFLSLERDHLCSTVELNVKYFQPLKSQDKIQAKAKVVNKGKTLCSVLAEVYNQNGKIIALATGTFNSYKIK